MDGNYRLTSASRKGESETRFYLLLEPIRKLTIFRTLGVRHLRAVIFETEKNMSFALATCTTKNWSRLLDQ